MKKHKAPDKSSYSKPSKKGERSFSKVFLEAAALYLEQSKPSSYQSK